MSIDEKIKEMEDGGAVLEAVKDEVAIKASEFASLLVFYYRMRDKVEGDDERAGEQECVSSIKIVSDLLASMTEGISAIISMSGDEMVDGHMAVVGGSKTTAYGRMQIALYMREASARVINEVKRSVTPDIAKRIDAAVGVCDAHCEMEETVAMGKAKVDA